MTAVELMREAISQTIFQFHSPMIKTNLAIYRYALMKKCWVRYPDERPGFDEVTLTLRDIVEKNGFSRKGAIESFYVETVLPNEGEN